jgi:hypothetical protein
MSELEDKLVSAIEDGSLAEVKKWLEAGADINGKDRYGRTPLCKAVNESQKEIFDYLLDHGARIDIPAGGQTTLQRAEESKKDYFITKLKRATFALMAKETPEWLLFGTTKLAHVEISPVLERKLTEIFNFESRDRMVIYENLKTGIETIIPPESFDKLDESMIRKAFNAFTKLGGEADEELVFKRSIMDKKPSPLKSE